MNPSAAPSTAATMTSIVIGASSGIGREIARQLAARGERVAITARRAERLTSLAAETSGIVESAAFDIAAADAAERLAELMQRLGTVDRVYLSAGTGFLNPELDPALEEETLQTNVMGFSRLAVTALRRFEAQGHGHLIGISSIAALRGAGEAPAYGASKAFVSRYLQGLRLRAARSGKPIHVTDVRPGFVDTPMMKADKPFWVASAAKAARQIIAAADRRRRIVYITRRWSLIGCLLRHLPE